MEKAYMERPLYRPTPTCIQAYSRESSVGLCERSNRTCVVLCQPTRETSALCLALIIMSKQQCLRFQYPLITQFKTTGIVSTIPTGFSIHAPFSVHLSFSPFFHPSTFPSLRLSVRPPIHLFFPPVLLLPGSWVASASPSEPFPSSSVAAEVAYSTNSGT